MTIETDLVTILKADAGLNALISQRVYLSRIPQNAVLPCLVYQRISTSFLQTHDTDGLDFGRARIQFDLWATSYDTARQIASALSTALNGSTSIGVSLIQDDRLDYSPDTGLYRVIADYFIWSEV